MPGGSSDELCPCKEEVEKEEAEALAEALKRSELRQDTLPFVPGLSRGRSEETLAIHVQDQVSDCLGILEFNGCLALH